MNTKNETKISKWLSLILRHSPEKAGLSANPQGWVALDKLLHALERTHGVGLQHLRTIVANNNKKRFELDESGNRIRARQGHSIPVQLDLIEKTPPEVLYHGAPIDVLASIKKEGLQKMNRHHVHLTTDKGLALKTGERRGRAVVLVVAAAKMYREGNVFYCTENEVWLTDNIAAKYISFP